MTKLSPNFTEAELTVTNTGLPNKPGLTELANLHRTADMMEQVRALLGGHPIRISSGYRSPAVNKAVHGSPTSDHVKGCAVDFTCPAFGSPYDIAKAIVASGMTIGQIINENTWVHLSWRPNAQPVLTAKGQGYVKGIVR
jgi:hypothetical protein